MFMLQCMGDVFSAEPLADGEPGEEVGTSCFENVSVSVFEVPGADEVHDVAATEVMEVADVLAGVHIEVADEDDVRVSVGRASELGDEVADYLAFVVSDFLVLV